MEHKDEKIKRIMKSSKLELPFEDFEQRVMSQVNEIEHQNITAYGHKRNALVFFVLGSFFGFVMNYLVGQYLVELNLSLVLKNNLILLSQMLYIVLILIFSDKVSQLYHMLRNKSKFMKELI